MTDESPKARLLERAEAYPDVWKQADLLRSRRHPDGYNWHDCCFLPLAGWQAIVQKQNPRIKDAALVEEAEVLAAAGAWRVTQGIYRFEPAVFDQVVEQGVPSGVSYEVLFQLPEWCVYVETPGLKVVGRELRGFFAHVEYDFNESYPELRLLLDTDKGLRGVCIPLARALLKDVIDHTVSAAKSNAGVVALVSRRMPPESDRSLLDALVALLLHLCSERAEFGRNGRPVKPKAVRTRKGVRHFPPEQVRIWSVGQGERASERT